MGSKRSRRLGLRGERFVSRKKIVVAAFGIGLIAAGFFLFPHVAVHFLPSKDKADLHYESSMVSSAYAGPVIEVLPKVEMFVPSTIRVTQTKPISISIGKYTLAHSDLLPGASSNIVSDESPKIDNRVEKSYTVELKVVDDAGIVCAEPKEKKFGDNALTLDTLDWQCTMHPKQAGEYSILVTGLPKKDIGRVNVSDVTPDATQPHEYHQLADGVLSVPVTALTVQGTTAGQWALLQALGAALGLCGTVLGYPFLKSRFEKKADRNSTIKNELKELVDNTTLLHNEMVTVFTPYLNPGSLSNKRRREHQVAAEQFAFRRDHRDKIERACAALNSASTEMAGSVRERIEETTTAAQALLQIVSGLPDPCFLGVLKEPVLPADLPDRVKAWLENSRSAHDAVIRSAGQALSAVG
jgi:hypothetical protein